MFRFLKVSKYQPVIIAAISFCIFIFIILQYTEFSHDKKEKDTRDKLLELLIFKKSQLEKSLFSRIYYTKGIAAYCSINPGITDEMFYNLADELINKDSVINSMALSRNCVINAIYPLKGHESAIGLNLLEHPERRNIVESTIKTKNTFVAGPVELIEGGVAFISYTPIFEKTGNNSERFWGVTDIVILKDQLFNEIEFLTQDDNYKYALRGVDGKGMDGACFWGDPEIFNNAPVSVDIILPTGRWILASIPVSGWESYIDKTQRITIILYLSAVIISILIWLLSKAMIKIKNNERELKALFGSMQDLIIQFNNKGEYVKIAPTNEALLVRPAKEMLGKSVYQFFDKEIADYFFDAIQECIKTKRMIDINYPLKIDNNDFWFHARISYLSEDSVIYVAHDNTPQKIAEEHLRQSEQKLIELNAAKDKFFSIIAHDLRSPFCSFIGISEELKTNINQFNKEEISDFANVMHTSAKNTFELLNNLLEWSGLQTGRMEMNPEVINIYSETEKIIELFNTAASVKSITIYNNIEKNLNAISDKNMLLSILRNLISNAIKFTNSEGMISINSKSGNGYIEISVADTGIGMTEDILNKVFRIDSVYTTSGTNGEKGTGLGLVLCKELIEKNQGEIKVNSIPGNGTEFIFTLPEARTINGVLNSRSSILDT